jgi:hypothetical protein
MLHSSVYERAAADKLPHFYDRRRYNPDNLSDQIKFQQARNGPPAAASSV